MLDRIEAERRDSAPPRARRPRVRAAADRPRAARRGRPDADRRRPARRTRRRELPTQLERPPCGEIVETVHRSLEDVRRIARELRPEALDDLGLDRRADLALPADGAPRRGAGARASSREVLPPLEHRGRAGDLSRRPGGLDQRFSPRARPREVRVAASRASAEQRRAHRRRRRPRASCPDACAGHRVWPACASGRS